MADCITRRNYIDSVILGKESCYENGKKRNTLETKVKERSKRKEASG